MLQKETVLKKYFGHATFRAGQGEVVDAILAGRDALCVMPTGAGKSVCYQVPAMILDGITLVISPLISLMKDQVNALTQNGIRAAYLNSSLTPAQYGRVIANLRSGAYKIVYVAPERLSSPELLSVLRGVGVSLLAVDEAHCISQWGQDFRPSYLKISELVDALGYRPRIAAFTATATAEVKEDIAASLGLRDPFRITTGFDRPNLRFAVVRPRSKLDELIAILKRHPDESGIVYCSTRKAVEAVGERLSDRGYPATVYHAGLEDEVRKRNQEDFIYDRRSIMVATNAFGMGIDKSNVSYVVHYNMPMDLESYYQEAGRAGRDGSPAECVLLYSAQDIRTNRILIENGTPNPDLTPEEQLLLRDRDFERLKRMTYYATLNTCLRSYILEYFGEKAPTYCGNCSSCLTQFTETDVTVEAQKLLSCIKRTGERFGKKMIADILRGSRGERLLRLGLDGQTTYGLMKEYSEAQVYVILDHLEYEGYIETSGGEFPVLRLGARAADVLFRGERIVMKLVSKTETASDRTKRRLEEEECTVDRELLLELKALRRRLAEDRGVPAYVVFTDAALIDMCKKLPQTKSEMILVSGVGRVKLENYGELFLEILRAHGRPDERDPDERDPDECDPDECDPDERDPDREAPQKKRRKRSKRGPFRITPEQLEGFRYSEEPITLGEFCKRMEELVDLSRMRGIARSRLPRWLVSIGLLREPSVWERGYAGGPTEDGVEMGVTQITVTNSYGTYRAVALDLEAQRFVVDHTDAFLSFRRRKHPKQ